MSLQRLKQLLRGVPALHDAWRRHLQARARRQIRREFEQFKTLAGQQPRFKLDWEDRWLCPDDKTASTSFDTVYLYHLSWAARKIAQIRPSKHVDISSSLWFPAMVSAFVPVDFYDFRPADLRLSNLHSGRADLTKLHFADDSIESLSCLHVIEHIGIGRYGDPLDPDGDVKAMRELQRVLKPGGSLLFVTPTGRPRIQWNAHRVYSYQQIVGHFSSLQLREFTLLQDAPKDIEGLIENAPPALADSQAYGCGCYWFVKPERP